MPQKSYTLGNLLQDCLDCDIRKSDIRQFFDDLKKKAHFVYAILCGAPKSVFWITLDDEESHPDEKTFSVAENAPFELTRETIKHYGFSREDVKLLRDCIASNNRRIIDELREEYERLKAIDCLQVVPPKRRGRKPKAEVSAEIQPIAKKPRTRISRKKFVPTRSVKS